ncbi:SUMF1/EgtB/PvdO family nonheme iron enzyme [bacterium]|nr:SUMF1/EgtB/PvdO family nonheme iron enzyme [bacterium]
MLTKGTIILSIAFALFISAASVQAEERYALLVGINKYNSSRISELKGAVDDVVSVGVALTQYCDFDKDNVYYLTSDRDPDHQPYKTKIVSILDYLADIIKPEDAFIFYFSGHGVTQNNGQFLLTQNADISSESCVKMSCLALGDLHSMLDRIRASKKVIIVDACRNQSVLAAKGDKEGTKLSAEFSKGLTMRPKSGGGDISFSAVLYACKPNHVAYEYPGKKRGFFSFFLTQALQGAAEALNKNGDLTLGSIDAYLETSVNAAVKREFRGEAEQRPWIDRKGSGFSTWRLAHFKPGRAGIGRPFQAVPGPVPVSVGGNNQPILKPYEPAATQQDVYVPQMPSVGSNPPKIDFMKKPPSSVSRLEAKRGLEFRFKSETQAGIARYDYRLDNEGIKSTQRINLRLNGLSSGTHKLQVQAVDINGSKSKPAIHQFTIRGNERPTVRFVTPATSGSKVRAKSLKVKLTGKDTDGKIAKYRCALGNARNAKASNSGEFEFQSADGNQRLFAQAEDDEGALSDWEELDVVYEYATEPSPGDERTFDGIAFVWIPAGDFMMGSPSSEKNRDDDEGPVHRVRISKGFWLGKYEITNAQYRRFKSGHDSGDYKGHGLNGGNQPVVNVSWDDAKGYTEWLSRRSGGKYRLPTEAEWEYACRVGTPTRFYTGDADSDLGRAGWYGSNSGGKTHAVGQKAANGWGLYDMRGNVWEWCSDWYGKGYYGSSPGVDPTGPGSGSGRVGRGGSWGGNPGFCRSAYRYRFAPTSRNYDLGFRVVAVRRLDD